ncbi:SHOCT domain-containing protein [Nocardioides sp.]|uniref:SHOCT domain-containing protein n=1 Tax=Nocardioides sp. TaxID=35761 RepID=UPI002734E2A2|nr:SHOCT domain-containing protein [Nocardioides sp.]MDP3891364.1 SHOCT domain-containing protein [Nocardioides sp.]
MNGDLGDPPDECFEPNDVGDLPTCVSTGDTWEPMYPSAGGGEAGAFAAIFVLVLVAGIALTVWRLSMTRTMAREAGIDPGRATAMTMLSDDGFEATYLAASLRKDAPPPLTAVPPEPRASAADRLRSLDELRAEGLVTEEEYAERRRAILDAL